MDSSSHDAQTSNLMRPALARRGFRLAEQALRLERVRQREAYVRERVYPRALKDLREALDADSPARHIKRAIGRHESLLSGYEAARARAWLDHQDDESCARALKLLLDPDGDRPDFAARVDEFLIMCAPITLAPDRIAHINETVASYLLAMYSPNDYAFIKLESAFQPAYRLLVEPDGERAPTSSHRLALAQALYAMLRDLWTEHESFSGDLLDVYTRLYILGSGAYPEFSWARALDSEDLVRLIPAVQIKASWKQPFLEAADQMRECCVDLDRPDDPFMGLQLEDYAHTAGQSQRTLAMIAEHGTRELSRLSLDSADAFGLSLSRDGSWRVAGQDGHDRQEAEAYFETRIKPGLHELSQVAHLLRGERRDVELSALIAEPFRALDAKILLLTLCAFDPAWTWQHIFPVHSSVEVEALGALLGVELPALKTFTDFLDMQFTCRAQLTSVYPDLPAGALVSWLRHTPLGGLLTGYLEVNEEEGALREEQPAVPAQAGRLTTAELAQALEEPSSEPAELGMVHHPAWRIEAHLEDAWGDFIAAIFDARHERLARLLRARKNVVLYGPPGTGKTILSTQLATLWRRWQKSQGDALDEPCVEQVTFHPSYGYEEFIEGFRPMAERPGEFVLQDGILTRLAQRAVRHPDRCFLLLIDELNRGDVARIFGELITLIEADKRSPEHARRRMLSQQPLYLPPNLYLLATMNTADKSISLLDVAIRRRFAFERVPPQPQLLARTPGLVHQIQDVQLSTLLRALNARLSEIGVYPERWLGHSFLWLDERLVDDPLEAVATRFRLDIIPLIEEYCFSDKRQMRAVLGALVDEQGQPDEVLISSPRFLDVLRDMVARYEEEHGVGSDAQSPDDGVSSAWQASYASRGGKHAHGVNQRYAPSDEESSS